MKILMIILILLALGPLRRPLFHEGRAIFTIPFILGAIGGLYFGLLLVKFGGPPWFVLVTVPAYGLLGVDLFHYWMRRL